MAFHEIKIGSKSFELAPTYIQSPDAAAKTGDYGFLLFKLDVNNPSISKLYSPSSFDLPLIKYNSGNLCLEGNILPIISDDGFSVGSSDQKFNTMYATTFHGNLSGNATSATDATNATYINVAAANTTNASYYIQFVNGTSGNRKSYTDANLYYNPSTNTLTTTNFAGTATNATYINVAAASTTNASYYIQFVNGTSGNRKSYTDANLYYNPSTNTLTTTQVNAKLNGPVQTTTTSTNASYYISFVNDSITNMRYSYVHSSLYYNPSTHTLTTTQVNAKLNGPVQTTATSTNASYYISFVNGSSTKMRYSYINSSLYYNPSTTTLTVPKIKYRSTAQQWIGGKTLTNNAFYPSNNFTTTAFFPILAAKTSGENVISLGGLGDQYGFFGYKKDTTENKTDWHFKWDSNNGNTYVTGKIYGTATHADNINVSAATTNATYYVSFVNGTSGERIPYTNSGLYYNPSTNELSAGGGFYERSDERLKDFQEDIEVNFSYLHNIPKKYYSWKDDATYTRHIGTSAQEVQKYYPELVNTDDDGYLTMNYDKLSVVALKAIDVLYEEVTELKKENAELKERLARLEELILNNK